MAVQDEYRRANELALAKMDAFLAEFFPGGRRVGNEWVSSDAEGGDGSSFSINVETGKWAEFDPAASEDEERSAGNDLISAVAYKLKTAQHNALKMVRDWNGGKSDFDHWATAADHIYSYREADGSQFCDIYRWDATDDHPKVIRPWDGNRQLRKLPPEEPRPLYNLAEIVKTEEPLVFVAGEKCVHAILETGIPATTSLGGEKAITKTDFSPLADRDVILWRDNDPSGKEWEKAVTKALVVVGVGSVRVVKIPAGTPKKWDAADADVGTRTRLVAEARSRSAVVQGLPTWAMDTITIGEPAMQKWIVNGVLPQSVPALIYGPGGCGKSLAALDLCFKVATRSKHDEQSVLNPECFLGNIPVEAAGPAIFMTLEDDKHELHRRMMRLDPERKHNRAPLYVVPGVDLDGFAPALVQQQGAIGWLTDFAENHMQKYIDRVTYICGEPPKLLVLDPAGDFISGDDNSAAVVEPLLLFLRRLAADNRMTIMLIGHVPKGRQDSETIMSSQGRGSGAWAFRSRMAYGLWAPSPGKARDFLRAVGIDKIGPAEIERVVFGRLTKGNFRKGTVGLRKLLMHEKTGLLEDKTKKAHDSKPSPEALQDAIIEAVEMGVTHDRPFSVDDKGGGGRYSTGMTRRRRQLPFLLQEDAPFALGMAELQQMIELMLSDGKLVKAGRFLSVPDGPLTRGEGNVPIIAEMNAWAKWPDNAYSEEG